MRKFIAPAVAAAALVALAQPASAEVRLKVGVLECDIVGGVGFIVGSTRDLACTYTPVRGKREAYAGRISRFGIDIGAVTSTKLIWAVFAPSNTRLGALAGGYVGASAEATVGVGIGANALIGGFGNSIALNPLSVQAQTGANLAAGVAGLSLTAR
ncbi:DUF992 domain-containing protein [Prosthecomicrobium sp. N25]|uniref:DUF992 domain-containing protein n=1 Tax=Prosthecomicrobium sp. N25 TaxID=3129254 RepID=UPI00307825D7